MRYLFTLTVCLFIGTNCAAAFDTKAKYALLIDADTGYIMYDKKSDVAMPPASMSKLMTAYVIFDALKNGKITEDDEFVVSENAWRKGGAKSGSSTMFLNPNQKVKVRDLLHGIIVQSGNDACIVAAEGLAGSEEAFADRMNHKAKELGLKDSTFYNATGLPQPGHVMSARDLSILARALMRDFPEYYSIYSEKEFEYNGIKQGNRNPLLYTMDGADGLKTGHTEASGYGLTGSVKTRDGRRLIMVVNGLKSMNDRSSESQKLVGYGLANFENLLLYKKGAVLETVSVWYGQSETVEAIVPEDMLITLPRGQKNKIEAKIVYDTPVAAPIQKGQKLGRLIVQMPDGGREEIDMVAANAVDKIGYFGKLKKFVLSWIGK